MILLLNLGAFGVFELPEGDPALGFGTAGASLVVPVGKREKLSLIPNAGIEIAPGAGNWGFFGGVTAEWMYRHHLGFDLGVAIIHDEDPLLLKEYGNATTAYLGFGPGVSYVFKNEVVVSTSATVTANVEGYGWGLNPTITLGVPWPKRPRASH